MMAVGKYLGILMLLSSSAAAQNVARVESIKAVADGAEVRVEITLSAPATPAVDTAVHPDRILLDFPGSAGKGDFRDITVNADGVRRVRTAQHSANPPVTRVVIELDQVHAYNIRPNGNVVTVVVGPAEKAHAASHGAPAPAASGNLIGSFLKKHEKVTPTLEKDKAEAVPSPATISGAEIAAPANSTASSSDARMTGGPPLSAADSHPPTPAAGENSAPSTPASQPSAVQNESDAAGRMESSGSELPITSSSTAGRFVLPVIPTTIANNVTPPTLTRAEPEPAAATPTPATTNGAPAAAPTLIARSDDPSLRTVFKVKYVAEGVAYLEGGRAQGLAEGMKLEVEDTNLPAKQGDSVNAGDPRVVAELVVAAVAETSAVTDIHAPKRPVKPGDLAYLSTGDTEALVQQRTLSTTRQYPVVISFTEGDTLDEEVRQEVPRPPPPSVNRARGRIGFDTIETISHGSNNMTSSDLGVVFRGDITRIGGTYWNLSGYWRGRLTKESAASQQTLQNLLNRTYHLNMTYDNPNSSLVAGFGRLYLPWAPSLDTIDGGYFGTKLSKGTVLGIFGGSTPDPSSWDYSPNRVIGGAFVNFQGGEYDGFHYSSTSGAGVSLVNWAIDRPFVFLEDSLSYKRAIAVYESAQLDSPAGNSATPAPGPGLGRNFFTLRVNPYPRAELDFNYNYFRDVPTFDPTLVGTGLLDKYLFQGFSASGRLDAWKQVWLSANLGRSSGTGDAKTSLNEMYGVTFERLPKVNLRADVHYARFNSSFATGSYEAFSLSRQMSDRLRLEALMGQQNFTSTLTTNNRGRFVTGTVETTLGPHYYLQGNFTTNRGAMSYDQVMFSVGYRFDSKRRGE
jgi:hypothetical protein